MPNGSLHSPIWKPYALYGTIDYVYGMKAWQEKNGWTAAQGSVNALETALYLVYLYIVYTYGEPETKQGRGAPKKSAMGSLAALSESRTLYGRLAVSSVLLGYTVAQVTFWKTVLYWLIEAFSGMRPFPSLKKRLKANADRIIIMQASNTSATMIPRLCCSCGSFQSK